jgi:ATP-dependent DNA ligase
MMFKNPLSLYHAGKRRANTWYKLKKFHTIDVQITGSTPGQGKYSNVVGTVTFVDPESGRTGKCSGMSDLEREDFSDMLNPGVLDPHWVGKWMEIRHFGLVGREEEGYRHPQFIRLRPDKDS